MYRMDSLDKGMVHVFGKKKWDHSRFHHAIQKGMQFKYYELFTGIFHLVFSNHNWLRVTETVESETVAKREYSDGIPEIPITRYTMLEKLFQCLWPNSSEKKMGVLIAL